MTSEFPAARTAIVTGAARRIGAEIAAALLADGWHVLVHCHRSRAQAQERFGGHGSVRIVEADLADPGAPAVVMAALSGLPPPALLVNNASRFVFDSANDFSAAGWDAHHDLNVRAPALLSQAFAAAVPEGQGAAIVNLLDAKLAFPNPDFFSYTASKIAFAGVSELLARALAPRGIRVCGIAPSVTLVSGEQSRESFEAVHRMNALGRGITAGDIVAALRFILASPRLTGETITLDAGQRFLGLARDVQFMAAR